MGADEDVPRPTPPEDAPLRPESQPQIRLRVHHDLDLDELDPSGRARRRAQRAGAPRRRGRVRRRRVLKVTALCAAGVVLAVAATGFYVVHHLFSRVAAVSLDGLTHRPTSARPNAQGATPLNILVLGSQTRDGQHGVNLGNATKDGTNLSDTAFLVHLTCRRTAAGRRSSPSPGTSKWPAPTAPAASTRV